MYSLERVLILPRNSCYETNLWRIEMLREKILQDAQKQFFKAMQNGYAAGIKAIAVANMLGHKEIMWTQDDFRVIDSYCVSHAGMSAGTTTI